MNGEAASYLLALVLEKRISDFIKIIMIKGYNEYKEGVAVNK
tara:strand:+ start:1060 stop:1185 length:126 start_codon:yes stop_codon:yes gene_type:complete